jgi:hypothetical protein
MAEAAQCPDPRGLAGLRWVFPSFARDFDSCEPVADPQPETKIRAWFCPFADNPREGVRYNEWRSPSAARTHHELNYRPYSAQSLNERGVSGHLWRRLSPDEHDLVSTTMSYLDWPFSVTVESSRVAGLDAGCALVQLRSPADFTPVSGACRTE